MEYRAPPGARGLKPRRITFVNNVRQSRPSGGAWIETPELALPLPDTGGCHRAPPGARGLKPNQSDEKWWIRTIAPLRGRVD